MLKGADTYNFILISTYVVIIYKCLILLCIPDYNDYKNKTPIHT